MRHNCPSARASAVTPCCHAGGTHPLFQREGTQQMSLLDTSTCVVSGQSIHVQVPINCWPQIRWGGSMGENSPLRHGEAQACGEG